MKDTRPFSDRLYRERMVRELVQVCDLYTHKLLKTALSVKSSCFVGFYYTASHAQMLLMFRGLCVSVGHNHDLC